MADINKIVEEVKKLTLMEMNDLVKALEEEFGVSAAAMAVAGPAAGAGAAAAEEKTEFDVILKEVPADKKLAVIKAVKEITGQGLKEAKELVEGAPKTIKEAIAKESAEEVVAKITEAGGVAVIE